MDRIFRMAEREQVNRHKNDWRKWFSVFFGQISALILGLVGILGGIYLLFSGKSLEGFSTLVLALGTMIGAAIWNARQTSLRETATKEQKSHGDGSHPQDEESEEAIARNE